MLSKEEQEALDKVMEVYWQIRKTHDPNGALDLTRTWAMFAKAVEENN